MKYRELAQEMLETAGDLKEMGPKARLLYDKCLEAAEEDCPFDGDRVMEAFSRAMLDDIGLEIEEDTAGMDAADDAAGEEELIGGDGCRCADPEPNDDDAECEF